MAARVHDVRLLAAIAPLLALCLLIGGCQGVLPSSTERATALGPPTGLAIDVSAEGLLRAGGGVFRSTDQGAHWTPLSIPSSLQPEKLQQVATTTAAPSSIFAGPGAGVLRSDDGGQTWRAINTDLPSLDVGAFAVHSFEATTLYAWIEGQGVFRTEDGGDRWQQMDDGPPAQVLGLAHSTLAGSMNTGWLYAATPDGPYLSMDCF